MHALTLTSVNLRTEVLIFSKDYLSLKIFIVKVIDSGK